MSISFSDAWRDFLIIRGVPYKLKLMIGMGPQRKVVQLKVGPLNRRKHMNRWYHVDNSPELDIPLAYPEDIVTAEIIEKMFQPSLGKRLKRTEIDSIAKAHEKIRRKVQTRLGAQAKNRLQKLISEGHCWEALFSIHPILEHRLRRLLKYKTMDINEANSEILIDPLREKLCQEIQSFRHLANLTFLVGAITEKTRGKILQFNSDRDSIAHELLKREILPEKLQKLCAAGLELMDSLQKSFADLVPKPEFIVMKKFYIEKIPVRPSE